MRIDREIADADSSRLHRVMQRLRRFMSRHMLLLMLYRFTVTILGLICIIAGMIMLVTPGPGWLFIFIGMGLWGTEFHWAHRLNIWAKAKVLGIWRSIEATRTKRKRTRDTKAKPHHCPSGEHYHRTEENSCTETG